MCLAAIDSSRTENIPISNNYIYDCLDIGRSVLLQGGPIHFTSNTIENAGTGVKTSVTADVTINNVNFIGPFLDNTVNASGYLVNGVIEVAPVFKPPT